MAVATHVHRALDAVAAEREAVAAKAEAYEAFAARVESVQPQRQPSTGGGIPAAGSLVTGRSSRGEGCRTVRTAFAETIRPHSVADVDDAEPLLETIRSEFTGPIATALSPATEAAFGPELKQSLLARADARRRETLLMRTTLERERDQLADAVALLDRVTDWIATADETPLSDLVSRNCAPATPGSARTDRPVTPTCAHARRFSTARRATPARPACATARSSSTATPTSRSPIPLCPP